MRLKVVPTSVECSLHSLQACAPFVPIPLFSSTNSKRDGRDRTVPFIALAHPFVFKNPLKSQTLFKKVCRDRTIQCSFSSFEEMHDEESSHHVEGLAKSFGLSESAGGHVTRFPRAMSKTKGDQDSFLNLRFDFLEPMMLGIRPEVPDWPDRETAIRATIEQKAKCFDIPLSLRMIKKKLQCDGGIKDFTECKGSDYCSVKAAFSSMVFIIVKLQSYALHMRESLCHEDLDIAIAKVQKEMHSSFAWLFQQVFSKTPSLMIYVMILLANFGAFSASETGILPLRAFKYDEEIDLSLSSTSISQIVGGIVDGNEATKMQFEGDVLDHKTIQRFVSPVSVEVESDGYVEYHRTDLLYQMHLSREPNNPLLLCNYGQFLQLVAHDYDRAEECYKRAVQVMPPDADALSLYANFLWIVRRDLWEAEERFLQALAAEPDNSYYASRYANFLWSTGGEETCYPVSDLPNPNL